jgi:hypothetical protein
MMTDVGVIGLVVGLFAVIWAIAIMFRAWSTQTAIAEMALTLARIETLLQERGQQLPSRPAEF